MLHILLFQAYILVNGEITSSTTQCCNYAECVEHTINSMYVKCGGELSCQESTITSPTSSGYIQCCGDGSCKRSALTSDTNIECSGHESCYFSDYLTAYEDITCDGSYSCYSNRYVAADPRIQSITSNVLCQGSGSCLDSKIESNTNTHCEADQSCSNTDIHSGNDIYCGGNLACSESTLFAINNVYCSGTQSCSNALNINGSIIHLLGYGAGFQSQISGANTMIIKAFGYYAMAHSVIDSDNATTISILSYGHYAAYAASIICRKDSTCSLKCKDSGCNHLDFICLDGSVCDVEPNECVISDTLTSEETRVDGTDCPNWHVSTSTTHDEEYLKYWEQKAALYDEVNPQSYEHHADDMERLAEDDVIAPVVSDNQLVRCGEYRECDSNTFVGGGLVIYCSGFESCHNANLGNLPGNTQSTINCMGTNACANAQLSGAGDIRCYAKYGCLKAQSITGYDGTSRIKCYGASACHGIEDQITGNEIECHGAAACKSSVMQSTDHVQCDGFEACAEARIASKQGTVYCGGAVSCSNAQITTETENIICSGRRACAQSVVSTASLIHIGGAQSAMSSVLYAEIVEGFGYKSLELATVDSQDREQMVVKAFGYMAGNKASVICRKGSTCQVQCQSRGCLNMEVLCLDGSSCSVTPIQCSMDNSVDSFKGNDCPRFKMSESEEEDEVWIEYMENRKRFDDELFYDVKELMVMQNENVRHVYHRIYLYSAIAVIVILMCVVPITYYLIRVFGGCMQNEETGDNRGEYSTYSLYSVS
eukprot:309332_1